MLDFLDYYALPLQLLTIAGVIVLIATAILRLAKIRNRFTTFMRYAGLIVLVPAVTLGIAGELMLNVVSSTLAGLGVSALFVVLALILKHKKRAQRWVKILHALTALVTAAIITKLIVIGFLALSLIGSQTL